MLRLKSLSRTDRRMDSQISQGGANLSGGQRQRLTIARALVGKPEILIMDDSASALDFATDAALRQAIKKDEGDDSLSRVPKSGIHQAS